MVKTLKKIVLISLLFTLIFGLSSCQQKEKANKTKIITFWTLQLNDFSGYINEVITSYEKIHPDVKIKWIDVPFSEGEKRALAAVMSNDTPDLINMNPNFGATLASKGALADLNNFLTPHDLALYIPESWQASRYAGMIYGVPWYITSSVTIYNKKILDVAQIYDYKSIKTYEDLGKIAQTIKEKANKYILMPSLTENGYMLKIFNKYDIAVTDKSQKHAIFNTPQAVKILSFWTDIYNKGYIPANSITEGHRVSLEKYLAGETAYILAGANFLKIIKENAPEVYKVSGVSPQITGSNNKIDFALMNLVVPKKSKNPKIAADFAIYLTNHENQLKFCKLAPVLPSTIKTLDTDFFKKETQGDLISKARVISAKQLKNAISQPPQLKNQKDLNEIIDFATQQALLKQTTPQKALNQAVNDWNKILAE